MTRVGSLAHSESLRRVVRPIVERWHPERVIPFGSHAYGTPTVDSDADLMIIMRTDEPPLQAAAGIAAAIDHPFPLDVLVRTPDDIASRMAAGDTFISEVISKGIVLYEAGNRGMDSKGGR